VLVGGAPAERGSRLVAPSEPLVLLGPGPRFVSRAGEKLDAALDRFVVEVAGARALDAGASTGGFVDCLLQRGAASVLAVDVGRGQLHPRLRADRRVVVLEGRNVRGLTPGELGGPVDLLTADLSFISLRLVARALVGLAAPGAPLIVLVKPQFEVGRVEASRGRGVITDPSLWRRALDDVTSAFQAAGAGIMGAMTSPLRGSAGNIEFMLHAQAGAPPTPAPTLARWLAEAVAAAEG